MMFARVFVCGLACVVGPVVSGMAAEPGGRESGIEVDPARFEFEVLAEGMPQPLEVEVAADGRVFWIELGGRLRCVRPGSGEVIECGQLEVLAEQEGGLIGMALDPAFSENGWVFLNYSPVDKACDRVSRFTVRGEQLDPSSEVVIIEIPVQRDECCHHAGSMEFGPDGVLFVATGDNTHPAGDSQGYAPIDERPGRGPFDAQKSSANMNDLRGGVLRILPLPNGGYAIPEGNLFPRDGSAGRPELYIKGCRNPWRISVDPRTGFLYWGDVGPDAGGDGPRGSRGYDEINQARGPGFFGWPYFIGDNRPYADVDFTTGEVGALFDPAAPVNNAPRNTGPRALPPAQPAWLFYPYGPSPEFPEVGQGGRTACAGPVFHYESRFAEHGGLPEAFDNCLIAYDWQRPFLFWARMDGDGDLVALEPFRIPASFRRPVDFDIDENGVLYMLDYGETWGPNPDSRIVRISYRRGNRAPLAVVHADPTAGGAPLEVVLSAEGTIDPDGDALDFQWMLDGEPAGKGAVRRLRLSRTGVHQIELAVTDPGGLRSVAATAVAVGNEPPELRFESPETLGFLDPGESIPFRLMVRDAEDGEDDALLARAVVSAEWIEGAPGEAGGHQRDPLGLALMKRSDCFNCHAVDRKLIGPAYVEVAARYRDVAGALDESVRRVREGSSNVWGPVPMLPHQQHAEDEVKSMVEWIFSLADSPSGDGSRREVVNAALGSVPSVVPASPEGTVSGFVRLAATYQDSGADGVLPLEAQTEVILRTRRLEAEDCDGFDGPQLIGEDRRGPGRGFGAIPDGGWLRFGQLPIHQVGGVRCRVSGGAGAPGGTIEFRLGAPAGELLGSVEVSATGDWERYEWAHGRFRAPARIATPAPDLYLVFRNPGKQHLMNLEAIEFLPVESRPR